MESVEQPSPYPYMISVRGSRPVPARREKYYYICAYETHLGLWWPARDVLVLDHDPHRNYFAEQRQAYLAAHPEAAPATPEAASPERAAWERADASPQPPHDAVVAPAGRPGTDRGRGR